MFFKINVGITDLKNLKMLAVVCVYLSVRRGLLLNSRFKESTAVRIPKIVYGICK